MHKNHVSGIVWAFRSNKHNFRHSTPHTAHRTPHTAHRTQHLQVTADRFRQYNDNIEANRTNKVEKIFKEKKDIKTDIWRTPLTEASERYLNRLRVKIST
jgi:hypothetical protein